jgi:hypothetical protein
MYQIFAGENLENWQVMALIGAIIFLVSGFLPLVSASALTITVSFSLIDFYRYIGQSTSTTDTIPVPTSAYMMFLTLILYPITVILGFVSTVKQKVALAAGMLGIICWIGALWFVYDMNTLAMGMLQYGIGIFVGLVGAIIMFVASFLKPRGIMPQTPTTPPPPS